MSLATPTADVPAYKVADEHMGLEHLLPDLPPGTPIGHFQVMERIGSGGMGVVYKAQDTSLGRLVAIKVLSQHLFSDVTARSRFEREARLAASISHPNVATVHEIGEDGGVLFIVMELVQGSDLKKLLRSGPLPVEIVLKIGKDTCDALEEAHRLGVIHRDIKSSNIMVTSTGRTKVLDFGLAKAVAQLTNAAGLGEPPTRERLSLQPSYGVALSLEPGSTTRGVAVGTPSYMSPEQASGDDVDPRSDIFSLGVVLYELSSGQLPFQGKSDREVIDAIRSKDPTPLYSTRPQVPIELSHVISRSLQKSPDNRYPTAALMRAELESIDSSVRRTARPLALRHSTVVAIALVAALSIFVWWQWQSGSTGDVTPSVAILPFEYLGQVPELEHLGALITDSLIAGLQSVPSIAVAPYEAVEGFEKGLALEAGRVGQICANLAVQRLVYGTVTADKQDLVIQVKLSSPNGETLWSATMKGSLGRPFSTIETLKESLLKELRVAEASTAKAITHVRTPSVSAYEKYVEAGLRYSRWDLEEDLERAVELYRESTEADPDFAAAHAGLARALITLFYQTNDPSQVASASEAVDRALLLGPELPEVLLASAVVDEVTGDTVQAEAGFTRAIEVAPGYDTAYRLAAFFYADLGRHQDAIESYQRAVALRPGSWRNHYSLGRYYLVFRGDLAAALSEFQEAEQYHPTGDAPKQVLGLINLERGHLDEAEPYFRSVLELSPNDSMAYYNLGHVYYYRGQYDLALRNWRTALEREPRVPMYLVAVGDAHHALEEREQAQSSYLEAREQYREMLSSHPDDHEKRAEQAALLARLNQCEDAQSEIEATLSRSPDSIEFLVEAVYISALCGDVDLAARLALRCIDADYVGRVAFDPRLESLRQVPSVREALDAAAIPAR
ncbi:MAG: protein kinase domain-containing protein [Vicinamibacteria bacterium]